MLLLGLSGMVDAVFWGVIIVLFVLIAVSVVRTRRPPMPKGEELKRAFRAAHEAIRKAAYDGNNHSG